MSASVAEKAHMEGTPAGNEAGGRAAGLVSVIMPVKNAAAYIRRTVGDIAAQTYPDIELIIAGPAEEDGSEEAVKAAFAEIPADRHMKTSYIGRPGEGVSAGRNAGIEAARGKYLIFFDGDDRIATDAVEKLVAAVQGADMAFSGYDTYDGSDAERIPGMKGPGKAAPENDAQAESGEAGGNVSAENPAEPLYKTPETVPRTLSAPDCACRLFFQANYQGYVWNKIFRTDIVKKHHIRFREDLYYNEDRTFVAEYLTHARRARMIPDRIYHYLSNTGSAMDLYEEQQMNMEGLPPADDPLFERRITELSGFLYMRKALRKKKAFSDAAFFCNQVFGETLFSYFFEILTDDPEREEAFAGSRLRRFARRLPLYVSRPEDEESRHYYRMFIRYGFTGKAYEADEETDA